MENDELIRAARLADPANFDDRFIEHTRTEPTYVKAYVKTESEYAAIFGKSKYTGYDSYRLCRMRRIRRG